MKNFYPIIFALIVLIAAHSHTSAQKVQPKDITEISLKTGDGFCSDCGRITTLRADGTATFHGGKNSRVRSGVFTGAIEKAAFARLAKTTVEAGFFDFKPRYEGTTKDVASVVITVAHKGGSKTVENFGRSDEAKFKIVGRAFGAAANEIVWKADDSVCAINTETRSKSKIAGAD